jgi:hypothetical protein
MIRVDVGENFIVSVALWNDDTGENASGRTVYYDIRDNNDVVLSPPLNGIMPESTVTSGIYYVTASINTPGKYICYATCSGFFSSSEEIIINEENIYELTKQNRHYNISVEDVKRTNESATASQQTRKVPMNKTDYVITKIKGNDASSWTGVEVVTGIVYAWYETTQSTVPYKMGGSD